MSTQSELNNIGVIAVKEFKDYVKSRRFILLGILYTLMALAILGITIMSLNYERSLGPVTDFMPSQVLSMMDILNIILVLLAVIITADTISTEKKDRTIYQLLSKPVERSTVLLGKFFGCLGVVSVFYVAGSVISYVLTAIAAGVAPSGTDALNALLAIVFMILMFAVYVALGILISTLTKNPLVSILVGVIAWIALFFSNTIGKMVGSLSVMNQGGMVLVGDTFSQYPLIAKIMVWIDPISHDIIRPLLSGSTTTVGMPFWANALVLVIYAVVLLVAADLVFERQDI